SAPEIQSSDSYKLFEYAEFATLLYRSQLDAGKNVPLPTEQIEIIRDQFDAFRRFDRFARVVAILNWLKDEGHLPALPDKLKPVVLNVPPELEIKTAFNP